MKLFKRFHSIRLSKVRSMPLVIGLSCFLTLGLSSQPVFADGHKAFEITILHTNDFHA